MTSVLNPVRPHCEGFRLADRAEGFQTLRGTSPNGSSDQLTLQDLIDLFSRSYVPHVRFLCFIKFSGKEILWGDLLTRGVLLAYAVRKCARGKKSTDRHSKVEG
jgi:hypothetical protein